MNYHLVATTLRSPHDDHLSGKPKIWFYSGSPNLAFSASIND
ncbi:MAG: hypothetical protein ACR9NN_02710 [Nostochopsis sp.]